MRSILKFIRPHYSAPNLVQIARRSFACNGGPSVEERWSDGIREFKKMEKNFCQAGNLLYKMKNQIPLSKLDIEVSEYIEKEYKRHRDEDLAAIIKEEESVIDRLERQVHEKSNVESELTDARNRLAKKINVKDWYLNRESA